MSTPFEMAGRFGGFVFTDAGKRRMLLRCGDEDRLLKVPRELRRRIIGKFRAGEFIRVAGIEERDPDTGVLKRVVLQVLPENANLPAGIIPPLGSAHSFVPCAIRVCSKKNCRRNGGRELWDALNRQLDAVGRPENVTLQQVGCLDRCKHAPNVDCGRHSYSRCSPADAAAIVARAAGNPQSHELTR